MMRSTSWTAIVALVAILTITPLATTSSAVAQPMVTLTLESSQHDLTVPSGETIDWTIKATVSTGDNVGLAFVICDLLQDASNPAFIDIPPGDITGIDATMAMFNRPASISNPGENEAETGYIGVQRGNPGAMNLVQIGGGQNTCGEALPAGTGIAENASIIENVGQGAEPQTVASGSFSAPTSPGTYTFRLENAFANVLDTVGVPPDPSRAVWATVNTTAATVRFTVEDDSLGDLNCDGSVNINDVAAFAMALTDPTTYTATYACDISRADVNQDDHQNGEDIQAFLQLLVP